MFKVLLFTLNAERKWSSPGIERHFSQMPVLGDYISHGYRIYRVAAVVHSEPMPGTEIHLYAVPLGDLQEFQYDLAQRVKAWEDRSR